MKIFVICSKHFYDRVLPIKEKLESYGHVVTVPNSFDDPMKEEERKTVSPEAHADWKGKMIKLQDEKIQQNDAVLCLNFEKNGQQNYIGGATFLEIYKAWDRKKKIFLYNPIPESIFTDELKAMTPLVIHQDLKRI